MSKDTEEMMATKLGFTFLILMTSLTATWRVPPASGSPAETQVVIGSGTAASCLTGDAANAFEAAVSAGGVINFSCGPDPVTIPINTAVTDAQVTVNGGTLIALSGEDLRRLFSVVGSGSLTLNGLTLKNGRDQQGGAIEIGPEASVMIKRSFLINNHAAGQGGAIYNQGTLTILNSTLSGNSAIEGGGIMNTSCSSETACLNGWMLIGDSTLSGNSATWGGGIYNSEATATINDSNISGNTAKSGGGGVFSCQSTLSLTNSTLANNSGEQGGAITNCGQADIWASTISGNSASYGGGINNGVGTLLLANSTLSGNTAVFEGGGFYNNGGATISSSTFSDNSASKGGGLFSTGTYSGLTLNNSLIANSKKGGDCLTTDTSNGSYTLIEDSGSACGLIDGMDGNIVGQDPRLGPLRDNGGPTRTHALLSGSPAIDAGDDALVGGLANDQRGEGFPRIGGSAVDMGAFESNEEGPSLLPQAYLPFASHP